jgi:hypothetical protein
MFGTIGVKNETRHKLESARKGTGDSPTCSIGKEGGRKEEETMEKLRGNSGK